MRRVVAACVVSGLFAACASLPDVSFVGDDGGPDGYAPGVDGAASSSSGGGEAGPGVDGSGSDGAPASGRDSGGDSATDAASVCPATPPPPGITCCGSFPCEGMKCPMACTNCESTCNPGQTCCVSPAGGPSGTLTCVGAGQTCPP